MKRILLLYCFIVSVFNMNAQENMASHLQKAVQKLKIETKKQEGSLSDSLIVQGQRVIVRKDGQGRIEHVGIPLFNAYIRNLQPSPIYDYLEFAALDKKFQISENTLQLNKLKFSKGDWETLYQIGDTTTCTISNLGDKTYVVQWHKNEKIILEVSFPIDYELLANSSLREMEVRFVNELKNFKVHNLNIDTVIDSTQLKKYAIKGIFVKEGHNYMINAITSNTYYIIEDNHYKLLYDSVHMSESMSNLLMSSAQFPEATINLVFALSTYREEAVETSIQKLHEYCVSNGCESFFGYEGVIDGMVSGTLIMHNSQSGYNHIFYIQCPIQEIGKSDAHLKGRGYIYTPSSNVKNLFATPSKSTSKSYKYITR